MNKTIKILALALLFGQASFAQVDSFPFELKNNYILIKVAINHSPPTDFVFDTGTVGGASIDSALAERSEINKDNQQMATVAGNGGSMQYALVPDQDVQLDKVTLKHVNLTIVNFSGFLARTGLQLNGLLGDDLMHNYVTQVDFDQKRMTLYNNIAEVDTTGYTGVDFDYYKGVAIPRFPITITLPNGESVTGKVMLDSGNGTTLLVSTPFNMFHDLTNKLGETAVVGGSGIGASTVDRLGLINSMSFNGFNFGKMMIKLTENSQAKPADGYLGILGIDVIKRFNLILDYSHKKIYMKPNKTYKDDFDLSFFNRQVAPLREGEAFLAANRTREGVKVTASGLQYKVVKQGKGAVPSGNDKVQLYMTIKLLNGKIISGPYDSNKPFEHHLDKTLDGVREGVCLMPVGSKYILYIPASLGFGETGYRDIPGGAALICEVELAKID